MIVIISIAAFIATLLGGLFALKYKDKLHLILGFSAGAVIGVAFFDLIPESIELAGNSFDVSSITSLTALGFVIYMVLDRFFMHHIHEDDDSHRGTLGAGSLTVHSLLDGVAIGMAFQVSNAIGVIVAIAVLAHDFSDGINTVNMILKNDGNRARAFKWLMIDALAPVVGVFISWLMKPNETVLGVTLALFAGFFLYIGASDLLPESHHNHPTVWTTVATMLGILVLFIAIKFAPL